MLIGVVDVGMENCNLSNRCSKQIPICLLLLLMLDLKKDMRGGCWKESVYSRMQ